MPYSAEVDFGETFWLAPGISIAVCCSCGSWVQCERVEQHKQWHKMLRDNGAERDSNNDFNEG